MMFAGPSLASCALASNTWLSTAMTDAEGGHPINISINNVNWRAWMLVNSLNIDDTLGEQVSCSFTIVNPSTVPVVGDTVKVEYYSQVLFAGTIDKIRRTTNNTLTARMFACTCTDWSQVLVRNKIERNFTDMPIVNILSSLLETELYNEGLTLGTVDRGATLPLASSTGGSAFDLIRDMAGISGQTFYVDFNKAIQLRATTNDAAPIDFDLNSVETAALTIDREAYRNVQRVIVKGTPASSSSTDALVTTQERKNDDQILLRASIEGGSGRYEDVEEITHPASNDGADLALLGIGYANLRLATSGVPRQTLSCRVRSYGFRAGQFATVDLSSLGISGAWLIQRVSVREEDGRKLIHELELTQSSLQLRAYESWLKIVKGGKITVQMPGSITNNLVTYTSTPGSPWVVPSGVTSVTITCVGANGGGGGGAYADVRQVIGSGRNRISTNGGNGGASGKAISIITVVAGQTVVIVVGSAGAVGTSASTVVPGIGTAIATGTAGTVGGISTCTYNGSVVCVGNGGGGGTGAYAYIDSPGFTTGSSNGMGGSPGSGTGDAVSVGGGKAESPGGVGATDPISGDDGYVSIAW